MIDFFLVVGLPALLAIFGGYMIFVVEPDEERKRKAEKEAKENKPRIILQ